MPHRPHDPTQQKVRAVHRELMEADDHKIRRVLAVVDGASDPAINKALLDPLRSRLAGLRPIRQIRFGRLLLLPLDPLIVPAPEWRPGQPSVPRTILSMILHTVRTALGSEVVFMDKLTEGVTFDTPLAVTLAGEMLWPRAADILATATLPEDWSDTGLRADTWPPLAKAIAAVLRRAPQLRRLAEKAQIGAVELNETDVSDILRQDDGDPPAAYAMVVRLILLQAPHATPLLRETVSSSRNLAEKATMRQALEREMDRVVSAMEESAGFIDEIGRVGLASAMDEARRMDTLLRQIELDTNTLIRRSRLKVIRDKLDVACRARFATGVTEGLVAPLGAAVAPVDGEGQTELEQQARDLRRLEMVARKLGGAASYDQQLQVASAAVAGAAATGTLTPIRQIRLIEILSGPEAAEALYYQSAVGR